MYPQVQIVVSGTPTTLAELQRLGAVTWALLGEIDLRVTYPEQTRLPIRATWQTPLDRVTRRASVSFAAAQQCATHAAAEELRLTWPASVPASGTLQVLTTAARKVTCANAVLAECAVTRRGVLVEVRYIWRVGAVAGEDISA